MQPQLYGVVVHADAHLENFGGRQRVREPRWKVVEVLQMHDEAGACRGELHCRGSVDLALAK